MTRDHPILRGSHRCHRYSGVGILGTLLMLCIVNLTGCQGDEIGEGETNGNLEAGDFPSVREDSASLLEPEEDDRDEVVVEGSAEEEIVPIEELTP